VAFGQGGPPRLLTQQLTTDAFRIHPLGLARAGVVAQALHEVELPLQGGATVLDDSPTGAEQGPHREGEHLPQRGDRLVRVFI